MYALQSLDVAVFKSLKDHFSKSVCALAFAKPNFVVAKRGFTKVFNGPFECAFSAMKRQALKNQEYFNLIPMLLPQPKYCPPPFIRHLHFPVHPLFSPVNVVFVHRQPVGRRTQLRKTVSVPCLLSPPLLQFLPGAIKMVVVVQDCLNSPEPPLHQFFPQV